MEILLAFAWIILDMNSVNERTRYYVAPSLTQNGKPDLPLNVFAIHIL